MHKYALSVSVFLVMIAVFAGCAMGNRVNLVKPTVGQELMDLQAAREKGALSEHEYEEQRLAILSHEPGERYEAIATDQQAMKLFR